ncbi:hypothetical protein HJFPF1_07014 [Paramyrothecium foliicola]|nr:hypothetical protein HJFPF1_07014 [Paramyrothecium foliicola]
MSTAASTPEIVLPQGWSKTQFKVQFEESDQCRICYWAGNPGQTGTYNFESPPKNGRCVVCSIGVAAQTKLGARYDDLTVLGLQKVLLNGYSYNVFITTDMHGVSTPAGIQKLPQLHRLTYSNNGSADSVVWAKEKIMSCAQEHNECRGFQNTGVLPTRLICINEAGLNGDLVLRESKNIPGDSKYVALSYCWGDLKPQCTTTPLNFEGQKKRIPWATLPKTFQDVVRFTRGIGIDYVWVDSVCIIQGDPADWNREAGKMYDVYKNSYVTLGALWGTDGDSGLFTDTAEWSAIHVANLRLGEQQWPLYLQREHPVFHEWDPARIWAPNPDPPLFTRAWVYQERLISPRFLLFAETEMLFMCFNNLHCQCGMSDERLRRFPARYSKKNFFNTVISPTMRLGQESSAANNSNSNQGNNHAQLWRNVVQECNELNLSFKSDKLPSIGAVAKQFHIVRAPETYLAGLWSESLHGDLLRMAPVVQNTANKYFDTKRITGPAASGQVPSWSWASVDAPVRFATTIMQPQSKLATDIEPLAEVVQASCTYKKESPYGVPEGYSLVLRGRVLSCTAVKTDQVYKASILHLRSKLWMSKAIYLDRPDFFRGLQVHRKVYVLEVARIQSGTGTMCGCVVMIRGKTENAFIRIGFVGSSRLTSIFGQFGLAIECNIV